MIHDWMYVLFKAGGKRRVLVKLDLLNVLILK